MTHSGTTHSGTTHLGMTHPDMARPRRTELVGTHRRARTAGLAILAVAGIAVLASACGGGGSAAGSSNTVAHIGTTTTTPGTSSGAGAAAGAGASASGPPNAAKAGTAVLKFVRCMRSHGVANFPSPVINGNQVSLQITPSVSGSPDFKSVQAACQHLLPGKPTAQHFSTAQQADYVKASQCMRAHGINGFPDPDFSGPGIFHLPQGMNPNTPQFEAARHICQNLIPNGLPYSATDENP
jgi:hypothetical protein